MRAQKPVPVTCICSPDTELHVWHWPVVSRNPLSCSLISSRLVCVTVASDRAALNPIFSCVLLLIQRRGLEGVCRLNGDITLCQTLNRIAYYCFSLTLFICPLYHMRSFYSKYIILHRVIVVTEENQITETHCSFSLTLLSVLSDHD